MSPTTILIVIAGLVVVVIVAALARSRGANDGVDSFRRQIDALSPEARRPVVDQVQSAAGRRPGDPEEVDEDEVDQDEVDQLGEPRDGGLPDGDPRDGDTDDEDGVRGA